MKFHNPAQTNLFGTVTVIGQAVSDYPNSAAYAKGNEASRRAAQKNNRTKARVYINILQWYQQHDNKPMNADTMEQMQRGKFALVYRPRFRQLSAYLEEVDSLGVSFSENAQTRYKLKDKYMRIDFEKTEIVLVRKKK